MQTLPKRALRRSRAIRGHRSLRTTNFGRATDYGLHGGVLKRITTQKRRHRPIRRSRFSPGVQGSTERRRTDAFKKEATSVDVAVVAQQNWARVSPRHSISTSHSVLAQRSTSTACCSPATTPSTRPWSPASSRATGSPAHPQGSHHPGPPPRRTHSTRRTTAKNRATPPPRGHPSAGERHPADQQPDQRHHAVLEVKGSLLVAKIGRAHV